MKNYLVLIALVCVSFHGFSQINKMEAFLIGTKLAFYPGQCDNNIPQAQGKLSFCDKAGNVGVVERSYGLSYRGVKQMLPNLQNDDEVYLTYKGVSIRKADGSWENVPHVAVPPYDYSGSTGPVIQQGLVTPSGKLLLATTNNQSMLAVYDRITKLMTSESFPVGVYPGNFVYDVDRHFTWILARNSSSTFLYSYDENTLMLVATLTEPGLNNLTNATILYKGDHIYLGNGMGLYDLDVSNYATSVPLVHYDETSTPSLPFEQVKDMQFDTDGQLWMAMTKANDGGLVKLNPANGTSATYQLPLQSNSAINHYFQGVGINENTGAIWCVATNYSGLVRLQLNGSTPVWDFLSKDSLATLGYPYTYVPHKIYYKNSQLYFTTNDGSTGSNANYEVLINNNGSWSGRNDDSEGNLSQHMNQRFNYAAPDDLGGVWWFNNFDDVVVYRDKDDNHQYVNLKIGAKGVIDADQKAIVLGGIPSELRKIDFPDVLSFQQAPNDATGMQRVGNQIWIYDRMTPKIDVYENNNLVKTFSLDNDDYQNYYHFAVDDENNAWFIRSNGTGGNYIRKFNTTSLVSVTYDRSEKLNSLLKIVPAPDNSVWFIGRRGLLYYQDNNWYPFLYADYSEFFNVVDGVVDENGKFYVLRNDNAAITTIEHPTATMPLLETLFIEGSSSILPALKHYRPGTIAIDSEGSIWTHASQNAFKLMDDDLAKEYRVSLVVANKNLSKDLGFKIYPNPSPGQVTIQSEEQIQQVEIFAATGQRVLIKRNTKVINTQLNAGVYFVKIFSPKGVGVQKLIVE